MAKIYDTLVGEYIKNPGQKGLGLDNIARTQFDYNMISYGELTDKGSIKFSDLPLDIAGIYSCEDVWITSQIYEKQYEEGITKLDILKNIEIPLINVLKNIEIAGVKVDISILEDIGERLKEEIKKEEKMIFEIAGVEFNIKSPKQVGEILFYNMTLPFGKKTKTGYSVDNEVLEGLAIKYPIAKHISNYRQYSKILSTYVEGLSKLINPITGKIHTSYNQTVTTTGRLSSTSPNLQNIPVSDGIAGEIRQAFVPFEKDDLIVAFDYSQVEVRLLAIMSGDENLLGNFIAGLDIHSTTGSFLFGKDDISPSERKIAKAVNFGVIYGISSFGLSKMIGSTVSEAKIYIDKFYEKYPKVGIYFDEIINFARENGYVETMFGRKRYISNINDRNNVIKKAAEREAINMPIQGTAADVIKIAMIRVDDFLRKNNLKSQMIMQVHDELVFNVKKEEFDILKKEIPNIMENVITSSIKLNVDMGYGKNWKEAK